MPSFAHRCGIHDGARTAALNRATLLARDLELVRFAWCDVPTLGQTTACVTIVPPRRGWIGVPTIVAETGFPFGLFRAWTLWRPAAQVLAYPRPEQPAPPLPASVAV